MGKEVAGMAVQTVVVMICDVCGNEDAKAHELIVDGRKVELEACAGCWETVATTVGPIFQAGRTQKRRGRKPAAVAKTA